MAIYLRGKFLRYRFRFAGKQIDESTKTTSKTIAREAERQHRRPLEAGTTTRLRQHPNVRRVAVARACCLCDLIGLAAMR